MPAMPGRMAPRTTNPRVHRELGLGAAVLSGWRALLDQLAVDELVEPLLVRDGEQIRDGGPPAPAWVRAHRIRW